MAAADGSIDSEEKQKVLGFIKRNEDLKVFNTADVAERFMHFADGFDFDKTIGEMEAMDSITKIKDDREQSKMCIAVCCAIGRADGNFDKDEIAVVKKLCSKLGVNSREYNL